MNAYSEMFLNDAQYFLGELFETGVYVLNLNLDTLIKGINTENANKALSDMLDAMPTDNKQLYIKLCENIAETLK